MRRDLPSGTVTLLFTDIEGSTRLVEQLGDSYGDLLAEHRGALREAVGRQGGVEVDTQGDGFLFVFSGARRALGAARAGQAALRRLGVAVRMGIHTGEPRLGDEGYVGIDVHRAARICAAAHGGQVLVSEETARLAADPDLTDLGLVRLRDLSAAQRVYQVGRQAFPAPRALPATNLPVVMTPLIGRHAELVDLGQLIESHRLVTLVGAGGCGKTRLALQAAADASSRFSDGVWWVPLAAVRDPQLVEASIAAAVGSGTDLAAFLSERSALLVLDNVEHLLEAAGEIAGLLQAAPALHVLVTSRAPLRLVAERRYQVAAMARADATSLFVERASAVDPDVRVDSVVDEICQRVDYLPLAIELAAARVSLLPPSALLARLDATLGLLTGGGRDLPERHRTLRATIDWSHDLLDPAEQAAFRRLSVFAGGCEVETALQLCESDLETLTSLVEKSLVWRSSDGRLRMLEVIREYSRGRLADSGEHAELVDRHMRYYTAWAEEHAVPFRESNPAGVASMRVELGNLRAAVDHALADHREEALRLGAALAGFWFAAELYADGRVWLRSAPLDDDDLPVPRRAAALVAAATLAFFAAGEPTLAEEFAQSGLRLARELGDRLQEARLLLHLAAGAETRGNHEQAATMLGEVRVIAEELGDPGLERLCLHRLGEVRRDQGDFAAARGLLERSLAMSLALEDGFAPNTVHSLGDLELDAGNPQAAIRRYAGSLESSNRRGNTYAIAGAAAALSMLGDHRAAVRLWECAEQVERSIGFRMLAMERPRYERWAEHAAAALPPREKRQAAGEAANMPFEDAIAEVRRLAGESSSGGEPRERQ
jgi:predicted ATPase/class 3 adenylate cyclase